MSKSYENETYLDLKKLINIEKNSLILNIKYFKKCKDYTDLISYMMLFLNEFTKYGNTNNLTHFVNLTVNFKDVKLSAIDFEFLKILFPFLESKYPDIIKEILCINVTPMFKFAYRFIKQFLSKNTRSKIVILTKTESGEIVKQTDDNLNKIFDNNPDIYGNKCDNLSYIQNQLSKK